MNVNYIFVHCFAITFALKGQQERVTFDQKGYSFINYFHSLSFSRLKVHRIFMLMLNYRFILFQIQIIYCFRNICTYVATSFNISVYHDDVVRIIAT